MEIFQTNRLLVRELHDKDIPALIDLFNDVEVKKYYVGFNSPKRVKQWLTETKKMYKSYGHGMWAVELSNENTLIGQVGVAFQKVDDKYEYELGCLFRSEYCNNGYAAEAAKGCIRICFEFLKLNRIIGLIQKNNEYSINLAKNINMKFEKSLIKWNKEYLLYAINKMDC